MQVRELRRFHLTGERPPGAGTMPTGVRPALLASFRDLPSLRYDYPLVLSEEGEPLAQTLSSLFNTVLQRIAPTGPAGERLRQHALHLERRIRDSVAAGDTRTLSGLLAAAARDQLAETSEEEFESVNESLDRVRGALALDGPVVDCDERVAVTLVQHLWNVFGRRQAEDMGREIDTLMLRLSTILKADAARSQAGLAPGKLASSVGVSYRGEFDFKTWSRLATAPETGELDLERRRRIENALSIMDNQRFFPNDETESYVFQFESCAEAVSRFRERMPEMLKLISAMTVARLEIENQYVADRHDRLLGSPGNVPQATEDLAGFPPYLVCLRQADLGETEMANLVDILSSRLPIKVLIVDDDLLGRPPDGELPWSIGMTDGRLANLALGLGEAFVMQSTTSALPRMAETVMAGIAYQGPSLFSVFNPSTDPDPSLSRYLVSAAAVESRAFPTFTYDPSAGDSWAERFQMEANPQPENDWPVDRLSYEDDDLQTITEESTFTFVDFAVCDARQAGHFLVAPRNSWSEEMAPASTFLNGDAPEGKIPYVLVATQDDTLLRLVVDEAMIEAARRCRRRWNSLQELGGIHNSHAQRLLERERARWEEERALAAEEVVATSGATALVDQAPPTQEVEGATVADEPPTEDVADEPPPSDEPYIETVRCTTCDECTNLNPRMFAYDENKQAYIADLAAGTYREMVEAAEACQVAIIHPGKPWNAGEPNLEELIERAAAFA